MKLNKIMLAAAMTFGIASLAQAADQGTGQLSFSGSIIDAPCSISSSTSKQDIPLGDISKVALTKKDGHSTPAQISIKLENCDFADAATGKLAKNNVSVTFNGAASTNDPKMLGVAGNASDVGIVFTDSIGKKIDLGTASEKMVLADDSTLNFNAYVQANNATPNIVPGKFTAVANFQMAYE